MRLEAWSQSDVGKVRKSNQDSFGSYPEIGLFIVADGMGGRSEGEVASRLAVETVRELFGHDVPTAVPQSPTAPSRPAGFWRTLFGLAPKPAPSSPAPTPVDLRGAVLAANHRVFEEGKSRPEAPRGSMGTTIVLMYCDLGARRAEWAHVGDSRLYRVRDGELELLTADHTMFGEEFWAEAHIPINVPHTNRLVRAVGVNPEVEVTVGGADLRPGDRYFLCSDGVSGMVKPEELRAELLKPVPIAELGPGLIERALNGGGKDNATAMLVQVQES